MKIGTKRLKKRKNKRKYKIEIESRKIDLKKSRKINL